VTSLSHTITKALVDAGVPACSLGLLGSWRTAGRVLAESDTRAPREVLASGQVPVMHGDCVTDADMGGTVLSGDVAMRELARECRPRYAVFATDVDGVFTRPPGEPGAELVGEIRVGPDGSWDAAGVETAVSGDDTTGGMEAKIREAAAIAALGVPVLIVRGGTASCARAMVAGMAAAGEAGFVGTCVVPRSLSWVPETTLDRGVWEAAPDAGWNVRGPAYLSDSKKVAAPEPRYKLIAADLIATPSGKQVHHISPYLRWLRDCPLEHVIVGNIVTPYGSGFLNLVMAWGDVGGARGGDDKFAKMLDEFMSKDDAYRNSKFKLIPNIANAGWMIQSAVGTKPVLLGKKLTMSYFRTEKYFEFCVDVKSSVAASTATRLVSGACSSLVIDLAVLIESQASWELPEELIGHVRLAKMDLAKAVQLDPDTADKLELPLL